MIGNYCFQIDVFNAAENIHVDILVDFPKFPQHRLDLLPFRTAAAIVAHGTVFRKTTGTLDKLQVMIIFPRDNVC